MAVGPDPALFDLGQSNGTADNGQEAPESGAFAFSDLVDEEEEASSDAEAFGGFGDDGEDTGAESAAVFEGFGDEEEGATESATADTVAFQGFDDAETAETTHAGRSSDDLFADSAPNTQSVADDDSHSTHGGLPRQGRFGRGQQSSCQSKIAGVAGE